MIFFKLNQLEYHLIDALSYFIAAVVPIYFLVKSRNSINNPFRKVMVILACFVMAQGGYHIAGMLGLNLLSKVILEPLSAVILAVASFVYFLTRGRIQKQKINGSIGNYSAGTTIIGGVSVANAPCLLLSASILTTALFLFSFAIFVMLAIKSKTIKSFQSQVSIFAGFYVLGEVLELNWIQINTRLPVDLGSQIHLTATLIIATVLWSRLFYSNRFIKNLVDRDQTADQKG